MSSADAPAARRPALFRVAVAALAVSAALAAGGCTVQPLYGSGPAASAGAAGNMGATLASISVDPVATRQALQVRNHLIFLLSGGAGNPPNPAYDMRIIVSSGSSAAATVQLSNTEQSPTSSLLNMTARYTVKDRATGEVVASGLRRISSAYDVPRQQYAAVRSQRDAEDRAARELAEQLRFAVAEDLSRPDRRPLETAPEKEPQPIF